MTVSDNTEKIKIGHSTKYIILAVLIASIVVGAFLIITVVEEHERSKSRIVLATTTSTYDSGLLDYLIPEFEDTHDIIVEVLSVGTGEALALGEKGDADVLLVHARTSEDEFIENGYGVHRACVMYNDFIIVGPADNYAGIDSSDNITDALNKIKDEGLLGNAKFYSRGDNSGTHKKELFLWGLSGYTPDSEGVDNSWYFETGSGMGDTLTIADQNDGYTLTDRGTWLSLKEGLVLELYVEGDIELLNPYGAILINPEIHENIKFSQAREFIGFLISEKGQEMIGDYKKNGELLFTPCFGHCDSTHDCPTTDIEIEYWKEYNGGCLGLNNLVINSLYPQNLITISNI
ncbi:MAG: substrate-binding domain-containing protein [Promethearchaeota archaeon]